MSRGHRVRVGIPPTQFNWTRQADDRAAGADSTSRSSTSAFYGDPGTNNIYMGQTIGPGVTLAGRESFYGTRIGAYHTYGLNHTSGVPAFVTPASNALAGGRVPILSSKWPGITWRDVANGAQDTFINNLFTAWDNLGKGPIVWSMHSEANGDEATAGPTVADYIAMYRHVMTLKTQYPQILLCPILAAGYFEVNTGLTFSDWMSSDSCDVFGFNSYNHISYVPDNGKNDLTINQAFGLQIAQLTAIDANKPIVVGEWGVRTDPSRPTYAADWMQDAYDYVRTHNGYAMCFFDSSANVNDGGSPWTLDYSGDGTDGTERINKQKALMALSTSVEIPIGGLPA